MDHIPVDDRYTAMSVAPSPLKSLPLTERTVSVAALLVVELTLFVKTARNHLPWSAAVAVNAYVVDVAPPTSVHMPPLFVLTCHCTVGVGVPTAATEKVANRPAFTV